MADLDNLRIVFQADSAGVESKILGIANALKYLRNTIGSTTFSANIDKTTSSLKALAVACNVYFTDDLVLRIERFASAMEKLKSIGVVRTGLKVVYDNKKKAETGLVPTSGGGNGTSGGGNTNWTYYTPPQLGPGDPTSGTRRADDINWKLLKLQIKDYEKSVKEAEKAVASLKARFTGIFKLFGRIALYRLVRSIIKLFTDALSKGLSNIYEYSKEIGTNFHTIRDDIQRSSTYLTNALGAAAAQIIESIYPFVIRILDATAGMLNNVAEMMAFFRGDTIYTKAIKGDLTESNEEASKLKRTLLGFDEINKLNGNSGSGSSNSYTGNFVEAEVNKTHALGTAGIVGTIGGIMAIGWAAKLVADIKKVMSVIGTLSGGGTAAAGGTTLLGSLGSVAGLLKTIGGGLATVALIKIEDIAFESMLEAETVTGKIVAGLGALMAGVAAGVMAYTVAGGPGLAITIAAIAILNISDLLINDDSRGKITTALDAFKEKFVKNNPGGGSAASDVAENVGNLVEDINKYADNQKNAQTIGEKIGNWFKFSSDALYDVTTAGVSWLDTGINNTIDKFWTSDIGRSLAGYFPSLRDNVVAATQTNASTTVNVMLDGDVLATAFAASSKDLGRRQTTGG